VIGQKEAEQLLYKKLIENNLSDKIIVRYNSIGLTYNNLHERSLSLGSFWLDAGVQSGERIVVDCANPLDTVIALLACLAFGFIFVPVEQNNPKEKEHIVKDSEAKLVYSGSCQFNKIETKRQELPCDSIGYILYTSGSTNVSKGVAAPLKAIDFCIEAINNRLQNNANDRILCRLPLSFDYGLYQVFLSLRCGAELTLMDSDSSILSIPKLLSNNRITAFPVVPALLAALLRSRLLKPGYFPELRYICSTGEVLDLKLIKETLEALPNVSIIPMYGLTECKRVSIMPPARMDKILAGSCGLPLDGIEVRIADEDSNEGELIVYGPNIMNGYWNDSAAASGVFGVDSQGKRFLRTGDVFFIDDEGFLYFRRRIKNMIKVAGHAVSAANIEESLKNIDGILDIRVFGQPDEILGESICACVYALNDSVERQITDISNSFPSYKQIRKIILFNQPFPTNKNGKVDITALRLKAGEMQ